VCHPLVIHGRNSSFLQKCLFFDALRYILSLSLFSQLLSKFLVISEQLFLMTMSELLVIDIAKLFVTEAENLCQTRVGETGGFSAAIGMSSQPSSSHIDVSF